MLRYLYSIAFTRLWKGFFFMKTGFTVHDLMTNKPLCVSRTTSVRDTANEMQKFNVNSVVVVDGQRPVGIITDEDFVRKVITKALNIEHLQAEDIMEKKLITIEPQKDIYDALLSMRDNAIRHLPVVQGDRLVGFLSMNDILKVQPELFEIMAEKLILREQERKLAMKYRFDKEKAF